MSGASRPPCTTCTVSIYQEWTAMLRAMHLCRHYAMCIHVHGRCTACWSADLTRQCQLHAPSCTLERSSCLSYTSAAAGTRFCSTLRRSQFCWHAAMTNAHLCSALSTVACHCTARPMRTTPSAGCKEPHHGVRELTSGLRHELPVLLHRQAGPAPQSAPLTNRGAADRGKAPHRG